MYRIDINYPKTYKELLNYVSEEELYIGILGYTPEIGRLYSSPLREDSNPSFVIYNQYDSLIWRDFGKNYRGNNAVWLWAELSNMNYYEALRDLYRIIVVENNRISDIEIKAFRESKKNVEEIKSGVKYKKYWEEWELDYWIQRRIPEELLVANNIFPASEVWFNGKRWHRSTPKDPMYIYLFSVKNNSWKVYRPLAKKKENKFRQQNTVNVLEGFDNLPLNGDKVIITSSFKDALTLSRLGFSSFAPTSESVNLNQDLINSLRRRFDRIIVFFDNDEPGINNSNKLAKQFNLEEWRIPVEYKEKDPTEFIENYSDTDFLNLFKT